MERIINGCLNMSPNKTSDQLPDHSYTIYNRFPSTNICMFTQTLVYMYKARSKLFDYKQVCEGKSALRHGTFL
jgi:hypothetical protein